MTPRDREAEDLLSTLPPPLDDRGYYVVYEELGRPMAVHAHREDVLDALRFIGSLKPDGEAKGPEAEFTREELLESVRRAISGFVERLEDRARGDMRHGHLTREELQDMANDIATWWAFELIAGRGASHLRAAPLTDAIDMPGFVQKIERTQSALSLRWRTTKRERRRRR